MLSKRLWHDFPADKPITNVVASHSKLTVAPGNISLKVLNATNTNGLAATSRRRSRGVGFAISGTGNAPDRQQLRRQTVVLYGPSRADSAKTVSAAVPARPIKRSTRSATASSWSSAPTTQGVKPVKVSTASTNRPTVRTGATNPCS